MTPPVYPWQMSSGAFRPTLTRTATFSRTTVPFVVFGAGRTGDDGRLLETIDIVQTFIDYFGGKVQLHQPARSNFETTPKPLTTSVTLRSGLNREWFIALYKHNKNYLFNVLPQGDGKSLLQTVERFEV